MARPIPSLEDCKREASLLLKDLNAEQQPVAAAAAERFRRIAPFREQSVDEILASRDGIHRKHALAVIAREHGYAAWKNLKDAADVLWCPPGSSAFWHNWCKTHEEARSYHETNGGYLLTAHGKCFIAERGYIEHLGLDPDDPRWAAIGYDVHQPKDPAVRDSLAADRQAAQECMSQSKAEIESGSSFTERYGSVIGKAQGLPEDAAENLDHYLYGTPKKE